MIEIVCLIHLYRPDREVAIMNPLAPPNDPLHNEGVALEQYEGNSLELVDQPHL